MGKGKVYVVGVGMTAFAKPGRNATLEYVVPRATLAPRFLPAAAPRCSLFSLFLAAHPLDRPPFSSMGQRALSMRACCEPAPCSP